jgi:hypothetical protein
MAKALSPTMTVRDFENGYWYREQLKDFAERIGIPGATKLRKDELEKAILVFLRTGKAALPTTRALRQTGLKDVERGLHEGDAARDHRRVESGQEAGCSKGLCLVGQGAGEAQVESP